VQGRIITFFDHRHYGFIGELDSPAEYFFHEDDLVSGSAFPAKGLPVTFEITQWKGRTKAVAVQVFGTAREILGGGEGGAR
jgi:cold shock CspA family protein